MYLTATANLLKLREKDLFSGLTNSVHASDKHGFFYIYKNDVIKHAVCEPRSPLVKTERMEKTHS